MDPVTGTVAELWRWPVAGLEPERLRAARLGPAGMAGDGIHLVLAGEEVVELPGWAGRYPFNLDAGIDPEHPPHAQIVSPDGSRRWRWGDPRLARTLGRALGRPVTLRREPGRTRPLLVSAQPGVPVHVRLRLDAPADRLAGRRLVLAGGVRLDVTGPAGPRGGVEARVVAPGRVAVGEGFTLA